LLGSVLNLPLPDNDLTRHFNAKLRKASLEALLVECLQRRAMQGPLVLVLEDSHWLDPLSRDLLEGVARGIAAVPVLVLLAYRPPESPAQRVPDLRALPHFLELALSELPRGEAEQLLLMRLAELFGPTAQPSLPGVERLLARAQGNPFYIEELLRLLQDQGVDPGRAEALEQLELPNSLHSLILSRIDRLLESQRITLKVASVIGRLFPAAALWGINARLSEPQVRADLASLARLELTVEDQPEPALVYLFRHVVTQEVAYESLAYGTRAALHNEIGLFLEAQGPEAVVRQVDLLAFHFDRGENAAKRRHYLLKAGEAAQARYANAAAISYYQRALPLLEPAEQVTVRLKLGRVLELVGNWIEASRNHDAALALATRLGDVRAQAAVHAARGELHRKRGQYAEATASLGRARTLYGEVNDGAGIAEVFQVLGSVAGQQGNYDEAFGLYRQSLEIRRRLGDKTGIASLFSNLGIIAWFSGHFDEARAYYESALGIRREAGDRWAIANSLNNLGLVLRDLGETAEARSLLEQGLQIGREIGDRWSVANTLSSLGDVALSQNDLAAARGFLLESLTIGRELNDRHGLTFLLEYFAVLAAKRQRPETAETLVGAASALRAALGAPLSPTEQARLDASLADASARLGTAARDALRQAGRDLGEERAMDLAVESCTG
jgi:tetratricopeptide (TPR) repeat protein